MTHEDRKLLAELERLLRGQATSPARTRGA